MFLANPVLPGHSPAALSTLPLVRVLGRDVDVVRCHRVTALADLHLGVVPQVVLPWSDWFKVVRPDAALVSTGVVDEKSFWNRTDPEDVGEPVCSYGLRLPVFSVGEVPVTVPADLPDPVPASSTHLDLLHEPVLTSSVFGHTQDDTIYGGES